MTRQEILKELSELEKEIRTIRLFCDTLEDLDTSPISKHRGFRAYITKTTKYRFSHIQYWQKQEYIEIPETLRVEISAKCELWIRELEKRANDLLGLKTHE